MTNPGSLGGARWPWCRTDRDCKVDEYCYFDPNSELGWGKCKPIAEDIGDNAPDICGTPGGTATVCSQCCSSNLSQSECMGMNPLPGNCSQCEWDEDFGCSYGNRRGGKISNRRNKMKRGGRIKKRFANSAEIIGLL